MTIEFSIITVTKNNLEGLRRTAESVQSQTHRNFEWIIVDGGSTDGSVDYIETLFAISVSEPDDGIYDAMNKGIGKSHGDYLVFMNAGDCFSDIDILRSISASIRADSPDFLYGDALESSGHYKKARRHELIGRGMFTHHQAMVYKRSVIGDLRFDGSRYDIAADYAFTARFLQRAKSVTYIPAALCIFESGGISQQRQKCGRDQEFSIRRSMGVTLCDNILVYARQTAAALIKNASPALYRSIRR